MFGTVILITWIIGSIWVAYELINAPLVDENERVIKKY